MSEKRETGLKFTINLKTGRITEKRDSASMTNEEERKKMKLDKSSSSGSDSNAKQGDGSEEAASVPTENVMDDNLSPILTEDKPRNQDDKDFSSGPGSGSGSGSVPVSIHDQASQTKKTGSSSASCSSKDQPLIKMNEKTLLYNKTLTHDDVTKFKLMIPLESGRSFLPEPEKIDGKYKSNIRLFMDHEGLTWPMDVSFDEIRNSYFLWINWDPYVKKFKLEAEDMIFIYRDPTVATPDKYRIEYEKKGRDSNIPKETT